MLKTFDFSMKSKLKLSDVKALNSPPGLYLLNLPFFLNSEYEEKNIFLLQGLNKLISFLNCVQSFWSIIEPKFTTPSLAKSLILMFFS